MTAPEGRRLWVLSVPMALLVLFVYFWNLGSYGLIDPDEGRYSEIPREMLESGDFVTPRLNYVKYFEKPVLHYWLTAGAFSLLGQGAFAARLVPALCGLGGCLLTFFLARRMTGSARAGGYSALVLAGTLLWFGVSRLNIIDMTLSFFFTAALFGYGMWLADGERPRGSPWLLLFYAGMALATLSKGLIGVVCRAGSPFCICSSPGVGGTCRGSFPRWESSSTSRSRCRGSGWSAAPTPTSSTSSSFGSICCGT